MLEITSKIRFAPPRIPYTEIANYILGQQAEVSLVFVGPTKAKSLNTTYRKKTYTPNVLTFPADMTLQPRPAKNSGEIFITPIVAKKNAKEWSLSYPQTIGYLFIHACLHLAGLKHGATMEKREYALMQKFFGITPHSVVHGSNTRMRN